MRRLAILFGCLLGVATTFVHAQTPAELAETAAFAAGLQNPDGGFSAQEGAPSTLGGTNAAIRVLKYAGGSIPDVAACTEYVKSCIDPATGGIGPAPGEAPTVVTTAVGLMALSELKATTPEVVEKAIGFLSEHAREFPDIRLAVAGLEAVQKSAPAVPRWKVLVQEMRNEDGTWGTGASQAFQTGGAACAMLRMGVELDKVDAVKKAIIEGQKDDGGWSEGEGPSTLPASYRVMRAVFMLKFDADLDGILSFIAKHRKDNGGYAASADKPADLSSTYYAMIMMNWARRLGGEPPLVETAGYVPLFNGQNLDGWEGDTELWKVRDGVIVGDSPGIAHNDFLATEENFGDFVLKLTFRMRGGDDANSGIMFHSQRVPGHEMRGYQADIGQGYWGSLYDESRRNKVLVKASDRAVEGINHGGWNHYEIRAIGGQIRLTLNGVPSVVYSEEDPEIPREGRIALQIHSGGPMTIEFKDIYIQPLPRPEPAASLVEAKKPGWHLLTMDTADGPRKYSLFVPDCYDGSKALPAVLFLHGAGERGEDGIVPTQAGLGPAIARDPSAFPAIAVFPQARRTWAGGSDDARAALATLDAVIEQFEIDESRIILTGLSMGGQGTWENGAEGVDRFAALVPVCGFTRTPEPVVEKVKAIPVWTFLGDADMEMIFNSTRLLASGLRESAPKFRYTEYRGVGHNSWDRAYNDPDLIAWMLSQQRGGND